MKKKIKIIPFEEGRNCNTFSIKVDDKDCETINFFNGMINNGGRDDAAKFAQLLAKIGENGALERYLRPAGKYGDNVWELPDHFIFSNPFRLYCIRCSDGVLILGNGGLKTTRTYQEDEVLHSHVKLLQAVSKVLARHIRNGKIIIDKKTIQGSLEFYINT